ncbi:MAG: hypothetical protein GY940_37115 [bacterium]|nr:hypothetical protein [bacterium]
MATSLHDRFLEGLRKVPGADVHLVAGLRDERIQFPARDEIRIFLPDLHLMTDATQKQYAYSTNNLNLLEEVMKYLVSFKESETANGQTASVLQIGDLLELFREGKVTWSYDDLAKWNSVLQRIYEDKFFILDPLLDSLEATLLLGNHDIIMHRFQKYLSARFSDYFPGPKGPLVALHGHIFSAFETRFPDFLKRLGVLSFIGKKRKPPFNDLSQLTNQLARNILNDDTTPDDATDKTVKIDLGKIDEDGPVSKADAPLNDLSSNMLDRLPSGDNPPAKWEFNVQRKGAPGVNEKLLQWLDDSNVFFNETLELDIKVALIGHTHKARIAVDETGGGFFTLVDTGAWVVNGKGKVNDGEEVTFPNMQVTALSDNDVRIYQMALK